MEERYRHLNKYLIEKFGERTLKICVDGHFTCPNRDGTLSNNGCIFCSECGSGELIKNSEKDITIQVKKYFESYRAKRANKFIVYFQNFTNTYDTIENLRKKYNAALVDDRIVGIEIATRPDCINEEIAKLITEYYTGYEFTAPEQVLERAANADILIVNKVKLTADIIGNLPKLRLICEAATGVDNIDVQAAAARGIPVKNAKGYSTHSVAEATLGGAIAMLREIVYYDGFVKQGEYSSSPRLFNYDRPTRQLYGRKWGIVGLGAIGHAVAELAGAFGCEVAYHSVSGNKRAEKYPEMELMELLKWADILSIHSPLNERTRGLIGMAELRCMKPTAILVNVARGGIVDEQALADALDGGILCGAVVDVFSQEPIPADNPLLKIKDPYRLLLSPHNAWSAQESIDNLVQAIVENIQTFLKAA